MSGNRKQVHLAAYFPGVNNTTVWSDPRSGSHIDFSSFAHLARTAERARFDFFFLAEGLRLREQGGQIHDLDVVGRPDTFTVLAALAAVTERLGVTGTINATFNEPYEVARQFASLDHLSAGRAGWNVVTSSDAFTGANFRRGGFLPHSQRYERAEEFVRTVWELWDSWRADDLMADPASGRFVREPRPGSFAHHGTHFDIAGEFTVPRVPQGRPVIIQAGDSPEGRDFAAATADVIFSRHGKLPDAQAFYRDVKDRLPAHGRREDDLKIMPAVSFALGDTESEAKEIAYQVRRQQVSPRQALYLAEQTWNRDLSAYDPDGPLPDVDPDPEGTVSQGRARVHRDPVATVRQWRELAEAKKLSLRELMIEISAVQTFIGTPDSVAAAIDEFVQADGSDGFVLSPHVAPDGLDEFAERVVPLLQERGVFRADYAGTTLREHLGLAEPPRSSRELP